MKVGGGFDYTTVQCSLLGYTASPGRLILQVHIFAEDVCTSWEMKPKYRLNAPLWDKFSVFPIFPHHFPHLSTVSSSLILVPLMNPTRQTSRLKK